MLIFFAWMTWFWLLSSVAGSGGIAAEIERAKGLLDSGAIDHVEYDAIRQKALVAA